MATPTKGRPSVAGDSSQQTNPTPDPSLFLEIADALMGDKVESAIRQMQPEIHDKIEALVGAAKKELIDEIEKSKRDLQEVRNQVLGAIAIFAAFFTFVSVTVNVFTKASALEAIALMIILWISLMGFTYTFFLFLFDRWRSIKYWVPVIAGMIATFVILLLVKY